MEINKTKKVKITTLDFLKLRVMHIYIWYHFIYIYIYIYIYIKWYLKDTSTLVIEVGNGLVDQGWR